MPTPATPINTPATAGPTIRAALNMDELSAIAFMRSSLPTSSTMNAWRAGMSNALTTPKNTASTMTCHVVTLPVHTSTASASASSICRACVHTMRSEEHTSELQSQSNLVCRLLLEKKKTTLYQEDHDMLASSVNQ